MVAVKRPRHNNNRGALQASLFLIVATVSFFFLLFLAVRALFFSSREEELPEFEGRAAKTIHQQVYPPIQQFSSIPTSEVNTEWRPSTDWIRNCSDDLEKAQQDLGAWNVTRAVAIGDCIKFCRCNPHEHPPNSFNSLYHHAACLLDGRIRSEAPVKGGNLTSVMELQGVQARQFPDRFRRPSDHAVVVHLRLGDIVEKAKASVPFMLQEGAGPGYNPTNFPKGIKSINEILQNLQDYYNEDDALEATVHLVGGNHRKQFHRKSRIYAGCLARALRTAGYTTTVQLEGIDPDEDFYFASHAKALIVSAGSFSNLMGRLAILRGGKVLGRAFGVDWN